MGNARDHTPREPSGHPEAESHIDVARFDAFYAASLGPIYRFIYSRVSNREEAEDLTSQVFMKALRGADWSRDDAVLRRWLFQVAHTVIVDHWRATGRMATVSLDTLLLDGWPGPAAPTAEPPPPDTPPSQALAQEILAQLPESYRAVLRCRFLLGLTVKETAQELGISEANAKVLQYRALKRAAELRAWQAQREEATADERTSA